MITFFNMMIAIMGKSFEDVLETSDRSALIERTQMFNDFFNIVDTTSSVFSQKYFYVIKPVESVEEVVNDHTYEEEDDKRD